MRQQQQPAPQTIPFTQMDAGGRCVVADNHNKRSYMPLIRRQANERTGADNT